MTDIDPVQLSNLQLEVINRCNFRCPLCKTLQKDWVPRRSMTLEEVQAVIDPVAGGLEEITLYGTRGEPLYHQNIAGIVAYLKSVTAAKISISTNGSLLSEKKGKQLLDAGLDQLVLAVDGITPESYSAYRYGGNLPQILENIRRFCELKSQGGYNMRIILQFIPMAGNEHELAQIPPLAYNLGVDLVKAKFSSSVARSAEFQTKNKIFRDLVSDGDRFTCPFGIHKMYVDPNGFCYPCCYAEGEKKLCMGNGIENIMAAWQSPAMQRYKTAFVVQDNYPRFCLERCYLAPRKKKILIRKRDIHSREWLDDIEAAMPQ